MKMFTIEIDPEIRKPIFYFCVGINRSRSAGLAGQDMDQHIRNKRQLEVDNMEAR